MLFGLAIGMSATLYCSLVTAVSARFAVFGTKGCAQLWTPEFQFRFSPTLENRNNLRSTCLWLNLRGPRRNFAVRKIAWRDGSDRLVNRTPRLVCRSREPVM